MEVDHSASHASPDSNPSRRIPKRRARQACVSCHDRKVKCDVSSVGTPCSNCIADNIQCVIRERARRNSKKHAVNAHISTEAKKSSVPSDGKSDAARPPNLQPGGEADVQFKSPFSSSTSAGKANDRTGWLSDLNLVPANNNRLNSRSNQNDLNAETDVLGLQSLPVAPRTTDFFGGGGWDPSPAHFNIFDGAFMTELLGETLNMSYSANTNYNNELEYKHNNLKPPPATGPQIATWNEMNLPSELHGRNPDDITFLRSQGCLSIPPKTAVQEYIKSYYLYVSPAIPMIPESEFETLLDSTTELSLDLSTSMSLFVLQAVLFASCSFTPEDTNFSCGFTSTRHARDAYYRRAKLLSDFETEKDPFNIARGALLLAYQAPNDNVRRVNCYWLNLAIRSARIADADLYYSSNVNSYRRKCLKRLWWSCVFRDRILPLGLRRPVQITLDSFDWDRGEPLSESDFAEEIVNSKIYDENTQRTLIQILVTMCSLSKNLTHAITAAFPIDRNVQQIWDGQEYFNRSMAAIKEAKAKLLHWYEDVIVIFPVPIGLGDVHTSVVLFANLMYIYFQSGMIALCHREALLLEYRASKNGSTNKADLSHIRTEIVPWMNDVTERMREVVHLQMAKYLPVSAVAYLTTPWVMHILDSKFASTKAISAVKHRRLHIFHDIMDHQTRNFDGTEFVASLVQRLSEYIDSEVASFNHSGSKPISSWDELLTRQPRFYLRICVYLDISFSKGEFPFRIDQAL